MQSHQTFITILTIFVFVLLTALFTFLIVYLVKQHLKLIKCGIEDEDIKKEYQTPKKKGCLSGIIDKVVSVLICALLGVVLIGSLSIKINGDKPVKGAPVLKVVSSNSMSVRYERNKYLFDNKITNQLQLFDLVLLYELPKEEDLKLYDIVVYQHINGTLLIHRIVGIEEPNSYHPNERYFMMQGDAVAAPDVYPVRYSQMKSIYRDERVPNVGSFVYFMQSPAGTLCFLLVIFAVASMPIIEKVVNGARKKRWALISAQEAESQTAVTSAVAPLVVESAETVEDKDFYGRSKRLTFSERLALLSQEKREWFSNIVSVLSTVPRVKSNVSKRAMTFRVGNQTITKISIKGRTLVVNLAVDPSDYELSKYGAKDVSSVKEYKTCPTAFKITSNRRAGYVMDIVVQKFGGLLEQVQPVVVENKVVYERKERLTFAEKIALLNEEKRLWFEKIVEILSTVPNVKKNVSKYSMAFRIGNKTIAKLSVRGKTLVVNLAVNPEDYVLNKYGAKDCSNIKKHKTCPTAFKISSKRRAGYVIDIVADKFGGVKEKVLDGFFGRKKLSFRYKLSKLSEERKGWYKQIIAHLKEKVELTKRESKQGVSFKKGLKPVAKITIKGKSLYVYLAVNPGDYTSSKYGVKDVSGIKAHANYPAQVKLTSARKVKYVKQIIDLI
ncbi:MAG: hypothetical protein E7347_05560 [Clostridiales bacterium]|nr:hypothetical protein [Clostridiales bacterium]